MSLKDYFKQFRSIWGFVTSVIGAIPFIGKYLLDQVISNIVPPVELYVLVIYVVLFVAVTLTVFFLKDLTGWRKPWTTPLILGIVLLLAFAAFLCYDHWSQKAIRSVYIPTLNKNVRVIIGLERSQFAIEYFGNKSDEELLKERGYTQSEIRTLWKPETILNARFFIIGSYFLMLLFLSIVFCIAALKLGLEKQGAR